MNDLIVKTNKKRSLKAPFFKLNQSMNSFWIKTKKITRWIFPHYIWKLNPESKSVYLTFDDGPNEEVTPWVMAELAKHNAKATFFCIGNNIQKNPEIFKSLIQSGHAVGNHTQNHLKGWDTTNSIYWNDVVLCQNEIEINSNLINKSTKLFRPPYGKIKPIQSKALRKDGYKIIMWDVISMDFDSKTTPEKCLQNVLENVENGSIIVFHDSKKAFQNLEYTLPKTLTFLSQNGYQYDVIR